MNTKEVKKKSKNDFSNPAISGKDPCLRRKCPECNSKTFEISIMYGYSREYRKGKLVYKTMRRQDAGSFRCKECGYVETY